jgi:hypothetical protein
MAMNASDVMMEEPALSVGMEGDIPTPGGIQEQTAGAMKHMAQTAAQKGRSAAGYVTEKAQDATASVGSGLKHLSDAVRDKAPSGSTTDAVANTLESTGRYLQEEGLAGAAEDLTGLIRRNPIPALLIGIGFGFLLAQATTRRS